MKKICAIYTRKSTDEGLDREFNTLDAQRESCTAYITSQRSEGWIASPEKYDDGGFSGGSLERPALKRLMADIEAGKVHIVVVYKIDRLTRSLMDFAKLVQVFDQHEVTFVSVTQSFNTTTSMGRLTLNVLLSFAQFEREVSGERIRDKIAASKARGMWMGGVPPVGYTIEHRQLVVNRDEVKLARHIFERYAVLGSVRCLKAELDRERIKSPRRTSLKGKTYGGMSFSRGALYWILKNPAYIGKIRHRGISHTGLHDGIIPEDLWQRVQERIEAQRVERSATIRRRSLLQGLVHDRDGTLYSPTFTSRHGRQYGYYISRNFIQNKSPPEGIMARLPAHALEETVERALRERIASQLNRVEETAPGHILKGLDETRAPDLIRACIGRVTVEQNRLTVTLREEGIRKLLQNLLPSEQDPESDLSDIVIPFSAGKARHGAVVIRPAGQRRDMFDMPPDKLKKLVQGVLWREDHFTGQTLKDIARREACSEAYVSTAIFGAFETLQKAFPEAA